MRCSMACAGHRAKQICLASVGRPRTSLGVSRRNSCDTSFSTHNTGLMHELGAKARTYKRGKSSDQVRACLTRTMDASNTTHPAARDPFVNSLESTRTARRDAHMRIFAPAYDQPKTFHRPRGTLPEYHSFSRFNALLKRNAGAVLNR